MVWICLGEPLKRGRDVVVTSQQLVVLAGGIIYR
jgi:hypothetical protein